MRGKSVAIVVEMIFEVVTRLRDRMSVNASSGFDKQAKSKETIGNCVEFIKEFVFTFRAESVPHTVISTDAENDRNQRC